LIQNQYGPIWPFREDSASGKLSFWQAGLALFGMTRKLGSLHDTKIATAILIALSTKITVMHVLPYKTSSLATMRHLFAASRALLGKILAI
jgi:hypothetical protein